MLSPARREKGTLDLKVDRAQLQQLIDSIVEPERFSGVVCLSGQEGVLFEAARGYANIADAIPNRIDTRFQIASGSKLFTSLAICQLVEQGKLELDSRLLDVVDIEFPHYSAEITIRHLLTHCSGITSYYEEAIHPDYEAVWRDYPVSKVQSPRDFLPLFRDKPMKFRPGERFDYNDGGYILLGLVIEAVSGERFHDYVNAHIFDRAGMTESGFFRSDQLPERTATAYIRDADRTLRSNVFAVPVIGAPDGGAYTTAADMEEFWRSLFGYRLLKQELTEQVFYPHVRTQLAAPESYYGLGLWMDGEPEAVHCWFVTGYDPGVAFNSAYYPGSDVMLTILANTNQATWPLLKQLELALKL